MANEKPGGCRLPNYTGKLDDNLGRPKPKENPLSWRVGYTLKEVEEALKKQKK
ncbi:MAG: hypothetical protein PHH98_01065 [Candidatus Gracilibacteria bacterium]|nr:hypothetical protein [Candidatus Gracilibacteria bacterium]